MTEQTREPPPDWAPPGGPTPDVTFYDGPPEARWRRVAKMVDSAWRRGLSLAVLCPDEPTADQMDQHLWSFDEASFIPHERWRGGALADPEASILVLAAPALPAGWPPGGARPDVLVQDAPAPLPFAWGFGHVVDLVDHRSPTALEDSRTRFKAWRTHGVTPAYRRG